MNSPPIDEIDKVAEAIKKSGVRLLLNRFRGERYVHVSQLYVPQALRGRGAGADAFRRLCEAAEHDRYALGITPRDEFGADVEGLVRLCEEFGFRKRTEPWPDSDFTPMLIRYPRHGDRYARPVGRGWCWDDQLARWVWKSFPNLLVESTAEGPCRYMGWDPAARAGKGEWYELPEFVRTEWVFQYVPSALGWQPRALTREQCNKALREDRALGFFLRSWRVRDREGKPIWVGFMYGVNTGRLLRIYEYVYSASETPDSFESRS
ncbi:hypothetical protein ACF06W_11320 [Streptomyces albus]|uniref:hypothetical protein n=1 Tax=Streptomyces albus TaxID=1888 RepID=UPI0036F530EE